MPTTSCRQTREPISIFLWAVVVPQCHGIRIDLRQTPSKKGHRRGHLNRRGRSALSAPGRRTCASQTPQITGPLPADACDELTGGRRRRHDCEAAGHVPNFGGAGGGVKVFWGASPAPLSDSVTRRGVPIALKIVLRGVVDRGRGEVAVVDHRQAARNSEMLSTYYGDVWTRAYSFLKRSVALGTFPISRPLALAE